MIFRKKITDFIIRQKQDKGKPVADFFGGVFPIEHKTPANLYDIQSLPIFSQYRIPIKQHIGQETNLLVKLGDKVLKGQPLSFGIGNQVPVHAPTSGVISGFVTQPNTSYFAEDILSIQVTSDGLDTLYKAPPFDYLKAKTSEIVDEIHQSGIVGLGGAGFPTSLKVNHLDDKVSIDTIILNAAECEPYISADDRLMREHAKEIVQGLDIIRKILHPKRILIGIEDNKPEAISALHAALEQTSIDLIRLATKVIVVPTKYPSGGAKQLVTLLTGKEIPSGQHASSLGILMLNVGTVFAIKQAIVDRMPLIERVVTFAGQQYQQPGNYWVRIGTPIRALMEYFSVPIEGFTTNPLIMGGPMMGYPISLDSSVIKTTNCLLARSLNEKPKAKEEQPCIRCGECVNVCPSKLLPQQLFWYSQGKEHDKAQAYNLFDCIECGACEFVCPSYIPLVHYYKVAKQEIKTAKEEALMAQLAKERYEAKLKRIEAEKILREERHKNINSNLNEKDKSAVEAAIARVKARKASEDSKSNNVSSQLDSEEDPKKVAIEAALARAKARKAKHAESTIMASTTKNSPIDEKHSDEVNDSRKAAVEAALKRAKEKRALKSADAQEDIAYENQKKLNKNTSDSPAISTSSISQAVISETPDKESQRKAAIEAARARALAKRALTSTNSLDEVVKEKEELKMQSHTFSTRNENCHTEISEVNHDNQDKEAIRKIAIEKARLRAIAKREEAFKNNV